MPSPSATDPLMRQVVASLDYPTYVLDQFLLGPGPDQAWARAREQNSDGALTAETLRACVDAILSEQAVAPTPTSTSTMEAATSPARPTSLFPPREAAFPPPRHVEEGVPAPTAASRVNFVGARYSGAILSLEHILHACRRGAMSQEDAVRQVYKVSSALVGPSASEDDQDAVAEKTS